MYSKLSEEQNLRKVAESLYIFSTTPDEVEKYAKIMQWNSSDKYVYLELNCIESSKCELFIVNIP